MGNKKNLFCDSQFDRKKEDYLKVSPTNILLFLFPFQTQEIFVIN